MDKKIVLFAAVFFFLIVGNVSAQTFINSCQTLNTPGQTYLLTQNILNFAGGTCMQINANNITLDCQGYRIDGVRLLSGEVGVFVSGANSVVVRNCIITDFDFGVYSTGSFGRITDNTANSNWVGIWLNSGSGNNAINNIANSNEFGFVINYSSSNTVANNRVSLNNNAGIAVSILSNNNLIYNNQFRNTNNFDFEGPSNNLWNLLAPIGGNYWTNPLGTGFSDNCTDSNSDGFCDAAFTLFPGNTDFLPLSKIRISGCPYTINNPGTYVLNQNLSTSGTCITINANNVTFDCQGYAISGTDIDDTFGITNIGNDYATVRNCVITDFWVGIQFREGADFGTIENNILNSASRDGVYINTASNHTIRNNLAQYNLIGFEVYHRSGYNLLINNTVQYNGLGIAIGLYSAYNNITNNTIRSNGNGIGLGSSSNIVRDNIIELSGGSGIYLGSGVLESSTLHKIYNNLLNNTNNFYFFYQTNANEWNTNRQPGQRIYSPGTEIGGNYWTNPSGNGYSDTCTDADKDGFCDNAYTLATDNIDYLPLSNKFEQGNFTITSCPYTISSSGSYVLGNNISSTGTCITINADNVELDCKGYTIDGDNSGYGIIDNGFDNIIIENCIITDFHRGIFFLNGANFGTFTNNAIISNIDSGIYLENSINNILTNNTISSNSGWGGIRIWSGSNNNILTNNTIKNNTDGIILVSNSNNILTSNIVYFNNIGFNFLWSSDNKLNSNIIQDNTQWDYSESNSVNNIVINLTTQQNLISFAGKDIALKGLTTGPEDPTGYKNINKYINATKNSPNSWLNLNINSEVDAYGINESSLRIWKYNGTAWTNETFYNINNVDTTNNIVYANITNFGSTFAPLGKETAINVITSCPYTINSAGSYVVTQNLIKLGGDCITVNASNVLLDCQGYTINGTYLTGHGVKNSGFSNITVKRCKIVNFWYGIYFVYGASRGTIIDNILTSNDYGIALGSGANNNTITNNTASDNTQYGILLYSSSDNLIYNNYFNNTINAVDNAGINYWNTTKTPGTNIIGGPYIGGNFWHDYTGQDLNGDGLGDTLLPYNSGGNIASGGDYAPLVKSINTPAGTNVSVNLTACNATMTFDNVTFGGNTVCGTTSQGPAPSSGFKIVPSSPPLYYDVNVSANFTENVTVCLVYNQSQVKGLESNLRLRQFNSVWNDITVLPVDTVNNIICGKTNHFSFFAVTEPDYLCGDPNNDNKINLADIIYLVNYIFKGGSEPKINITSGDANGNGAVNLADIIYLVNYIFKGGPAPANCGGSIVSLSSGSSTISLGSALNNFDGTYRIPVSESNNIAVAGNKIEVSYDPTKVSVLNVTNTLRTSGLSLIVNDNKNGKLLIGLWSPDSSKSIAPGNSVIVNLKVKGTDVGSVRVNYGETVDTSAKAMKTNLFNPTTTAKTTNVIA